MPRHPDLKAALDLYARLPGPSRRPSRSDWATAHALLIAGISLQTLQAAMLLATLRRHQQPPDQPPLEPVRSFAYYRPLALHLHRQPLDPGYLGYLHESFRATFPGYKSPLETETAPHRQNPALFRSR